MAYMPKNVLELKRAKSYAPVCLRREAEESVLLDALDGGIETSELVS